MCGIVGYKGARNVKEVLIKGLKALEYRGYDSSGVALLDDGEIKIIKSVGKIDELEKKLNKENKGIYIYNLGTGKGYSVLEIIKVFCCETNKEVPYKIVGRRPGDIAICYSNPKKAEEELGFKATKTLEDMCKDSWNFINKKEL